MTNVYCTKSINSPVTHHRPSQIGEKSQLSHGHHARWQNHFVRSKLTVFVMGGWVLYCTITTDHSRLVMCDAHSSLDLMFTTQSLNVMRDGWKKIVHWRKMFTLTTKLPTSIALGSVHWQLWCVTNYKLVQFTTPCDAWHERSVIIVQYTN